MFIDNPQIYLKNLFSILLLIFRPIQTHSIVSFPFLKISWLRFRQRWWRCHENKN